MSADLHTGHPNRRRFLESTALASLLSPSLLANSIAPKAKRIIYLFMHGGPPQMELFDPKPALLKRRGEELPESVRKTQRLTGMTSGQKSFPIVPGSFRFKQHGQSGATISELLPHLSGVADDLCFIKSMYTEAINHDPAVTYLQTGHQQPGRPSFGAWLSYGLGSENHDLPAFVVLLSNGSATRPTDPLHARLWGPGFLPSNHQGVQFRSGKDPVLYLSNPPDIDSASRQRMIRSLAQLNREQYERAGDPEILTRTRQFELAYRMQMSVPELTDLSSEPASTRRLYGSGPFARNCILARRLAERGVRFIQLYHRGWDQHYNLPTDLRLQCGDVDRACAGLVRDLKQRGLLDETLIVWAGEFGRTIYSQGTLEYNNYGRDHHGGCFSIWLAGGGIKPGVSHGSTDEFSFNVAHNGVHVHDLNATLLDRLGINHERLTFKFQGRHYRLTDVHGHVVRGVLA